MAKAAVDNSGRVALIMDREQAEIVSALLASAYDATEDDNLVGPLNDEIQDVYTALSLAGITGPFTFKVEEIGVERRAQANA